jgi:hypothetical protein
MRIWTERQIELRGFYEINLTSTALALLLASGHPALASVKVHIARAHATIAGNCSIQTQRRVFGCE